MTKNLITRMNKKLAPLRQNAATHTIQLKLHERLNKKQIVRSYGRNKNLDEEIKKTKRRTIVAPVITVRPLPNWSMRSIINETK